MKSFDELKSLIDQRGVHEVFGDYGEGWGIEQSSAELAEFLVEMQNLDVQSVLEIGTGYKAGLARFLHDDMDYEVTSVDIHDYGHQYGGITFINDCIPGLEYPVFERGFDLVIIDGDHTYDAVRFDHDYYCKYATNAVMFHDIAGLRDCEGVARYWVEISRTPENDLKPGFHEIIADGDQRSGIGYLVISEVEKQVQWLPIIAAEMPTTVPIIKKPTAPRKPAAKKKPVTKKAPAKK